MMDYSAALADITKTLTEIKDFFSQNPTTISAISATASLIAAVASLWAASSAYRATRNVKKIARLEILRKLIQNGYDVISEVEQIGSLVGEVKTQFKELMRHATGSASEARVNEIAGCAESKYKEILPLGEEAEKLVADRSDLEKKSEDELSKQLSKFDGYVSTVRRVRTSLEKEVESYADQNREYRRERR